MRIRPNAASNRGIALIIVMVVIIVLAILAGGFAYSMKVETTLARNATFDTELEWMGRSGIELARYVLAQSGLGPAGQYDSLKHKWAGGPGETNDPISEIPLESFPLGRGTVSVKITDLDRKFNINSADDVILRQALTLVGVDAGVFPTIVDSILDWRDPDDDTHLSGTESMYYQTLAPPYFAKNGPIDDLTELLLIRDVTPAMYWGSAAQGHRQVFNRPPGVRRSAFDEEPAYAVGLVDLFTTLSGQRVNINTASPTVLQVIPEIDENVASSIISGPLGRAGPDGADGTEDDNPFRSINDLQRVPGMNPVALQLLSRYFSVRSAVFEVKVDVSIDNRSRHYVAVLRRGNNPRDIQPLYMYWNNPK